MINAAISNDILSSHENSVNEPCVEGTPKCHSKKRTLKESMYDKENIPTEDNNIKDVLKPPAKRMLLEWDVTGQKSSKGKAAGKTMSKRKKIPLLQGQRQLTNFFR